MARRFINLRDFAPTPSFVATRGDRVVISAALWGGPAHQSVKLCCAAAYELGRELVDHSEGLIAGIDRPPYDYRSAAPDARQRAGSDGGRADRRAPNRPTGAAGSDR